VALLVGAAVSIRKVVGLNGEEVGGGGGGVHCNVADNDGGVAAVVSMLLVDTVGALLDVVAQYSRLYRPVVFASSKRPRFESDNEERIVVESPSRVEQVCVDEMR
jgi:hypothetical protein